MRGGTAQAEETDEPVVALRDRLQRAARLDDIAFRLHHGIERARSRASHVRRANRQLVQAFDADPAAGRQSERDRSERLVAASSEYLGLLDDRLADEYALLADCRNGAEAMRRTAVAIEQYQRVGAIVKRAPSLVAGPDGAAATVAAVRRPLEAQADAKDRAADPKHEPAPNATIPDPAAAPTPPATPAGIDPSELARRAAIAAAAARSTGR